MIYIHISHHKVTSFTREFYVDFILKNDDKQHTLLYYAYDHTKNKLVFSFDIDSHNKSIKLGGQNFQVKIVQ